MARTSGLRGLLSCWLGGWWLLPGGFWRVRRLPLLGALLGLALAAPLLVAVACPPLCATYSEYDIAESQHLACASTQSHSKTAPLPG